MAKGRKALAEVLGPDRVMQIQLIERLLDTITQKPEIVEGLLKNLNNLTVVTGRDRGGLSSLGAVLGGSPLFTGRATQQQK